MIAVNAEPMGDKVTPWLSNAARYFTRGKPRTALAVMLSDGNIYVLREFWGDSTKLTASMAAFDRAFSMRPRPESRVV